MSTSRWTAADIPPQVGRTFVVTGATGGPGAVTARELGSTTLCEGSRERTDGRLDIAGTPPR